jgi:hypothetical protein
LELKLNKDYWPTDKGNWTVSCSDTVTASAKHKGHKHGAVLVTCIFISGPNQKEIGKSINISMSGPFSIQRAITENYPQAILVSHITNPLPVIAKPSALASMASMMKTFITVRCHTKGRLQVNMSKQARHSFVAFTAITQVIAASGAFGYTSAFLPPEPKNQRESRLRPDVHDWVQSEHVEMDTVMGMGTIEYVPSCKVPKGTTLLPTKFSYKCKFGEEGEIIKKKARLCARGDLQRDEEYSETFAPTSRFNALRTLFAMATQLDYSLYQFDIRGAFMTSDIDENDIYIQLPPGYEAPPGTVAKLSKSLYGLKNSAYLFHKSLSTWMLDYGFKAIDSDETMFRYVGEHGTLILALYVDDGLVACSSDKEYEIFIEALKERFELSTETKEVSWYLGVSVKRDLKNGTLHLSQEKYINDLLSRFKMEDATPALTSMEIGARLTSDDCPSKDEADKNVIRNYQQMVGSLMYVVAWCHPEISFSVQQCAKYMSSPGLSHIKAAKQILCYLKGAKAIGLTYRRGQPTLTNFMAMLMRTMQVTPRVREVLLDTWF